MYLLVDQRNSQNHTENQLDRTEIRKICQETNSCSIFTHAEIIGLTFGGLGLVLDFLFQPSHFRRLNLKPPNSLSEPIKVFLLVFGGIIYWAIKTRCTCYRTQYKRSFKESGIKPRPARYSIASGNHLPPEISEISTVPDVPTVSEVYSIEGHLRTSKTRVRNHDNNLSAYIYSNHARKSC